MGGPSQFSDGRWSPRHVAPTEPRHLAPKVTAAEALSTVEGRTRRLVTLALQDVLIVGRAMEERHRDEHTDQEDG